MTASDDRIAYWTRQIAALRKDAAKRARSAPPTDLVERALELSDALLRDLAGAGLECEQARDQRRLADAAWEELFQSVPLPAVLTDPAGVILSANRAAATLLNVSVRHLGTRELMMFAEDREAFATLMQGLSAQHRDERRSTLTVRPRERRPVPVEVLVATLSNATERRLWFLTPAEARARANARIEMENTAHEGVNPFLDRAQS